MTYNVHSCVGTDGQYSIERIIRVIEKSRADIVALQELDGGRHFNGINSQAEFIAGKLGMHFHFHSAYGEKKKDFGNAILSRYPMKVIKAARLPKYGWKNLFESRGILWVKIEYEKTCINVLTTHLSLWLPERRNQTSLLLNHHWTSHEILKEGPVILCGDFNMAPSSDLYRQIIREFRDAAGSVKDKRQLRTWTSSFPIRRLDYIFYRGGFRIKEIQVPKRGLEKAASDHLPVIAELSLKGPKENSDGENARIYN